MPFRPLRPCGPGCPTLTRGERCPQCRAAKHRRIDAHRGTATERGYATTRWQKYRAWWRLRYPLCGDRVTGRSGEHSRCWRAGKLVPMKDLDHIRPATGPDDPAFYDSANHQSLCHACHSAKTLAELKASA